MNNKEKLLDEWFWKQYLIQVDRKYQWNTEYIISKNDSDEARIWQLSMSNTPEQAADKELNKDVGYEDWAYGGY